MAGVQQLEAPVNAGAGAGATGASLDNLTPSLGLAATKRQRRPSVRLGDIGDQPATLAHDPFLRRTKQWSDYGKYRFSFQKDPAGAAKGSKTRPLTNLSNGGESHEVEETEDKDVIIGGGGGGGGGGDGSFDLLGIGNRKAKRGLPAKRPRSNWMASASSKVDEGGIIGEEKLSGEEEGGGGGEAFRDFNVEVSESPLKEQSPMHCLENPVAIDSRQHSGEGVFSGQRRAVSTRARFSESRDHDGIELDGPSDTDARDWKCGISLDGNGGLEKGASWSLEDGILMWLNGLGLGRYLPVFEIHEVDEEVLPLLTLEDLKDMGINAVGSRRKLYSAIQKLAKGFS